MSEIELRLPQEDKIISRAGLLKKLQEIENKKKRAPKAQLKTLQAQVALIREGLDEALLTRFDKLMERYGFAVAEVDEGVCQGCFISVSTEMSSAIEGSNDIYVCENCGKVECLKAAQIPEGFVRSLGVDGHYTIRYPEVVLHGLCPKCQ